MSNKAKKTAKELERLQTLYQSDDTKETVKQSTPVASNVSNTVTIARHAAIKKELVFLVVLIIVMLALLFAVNYWASSNDLSGWISNIF